MDVLPKRLLVGAQMVLRIYKNRSTEKWCGPCLIRIRQQISRGIKPWLNSKPKVSSLLFSFSSSSGHTARVQFDPFDDDLIITYLHFNTLLLKMYLLHYRRLKSGVPTNNLSRGTALDVSSDHHKHEEWSKWWWSLEHRIHPPAAAAVARFTTRTGDSDLTLGCIYCPRGAAAGQLRFERFYSIADREQFGNTFFMVLFYKVTHTHGTTTIHQNNCWYLDNHKGKAYFIAIINCLLIGHNISHKRVS